MTMRKSLSAATVATLKEVGRYCVSDTLYLQIAEGGSRSWVFRFMLNGRSRHAGLGPCDLVSLAQARSKVLDMRRTLLEGTDPLEARRAQHRERLLEAASGKSFEECARAFISAHEAGWGPKSRQQ